MCSCSLPLSLAEGKKHGVGEVAKSGRGGEMDDGGTVREGELGAADRA